MVSYEMCMCDMYRGSMYRDNDRLCICIWCIEIFGLWYDVNCVNLMGVYVNLGNLV